MSLEKKSNQLKELIAKFNSDWLLGDLSSLIHAGRDRASDQLGMLSSPMRQLYYLAGLNVSSDPAKGFDIMFDHEKWKQIATLLNEIEAEYDKLFFPTKQEEITEVWKRIRKVVMPSFLSYFNQGPLNYEEQVINWIEDLFSQFDPIIESKTNLKTEDFIHFYDNLDQLRQRNFQAHSGRKDLLRPNWEKYSKIEMGVVDDVPDFIKEMGEQYKEMNYYMSDSGIIDRFYAEELVSEILPLDKVNNILPYFVTTRAQTDFLFYTSTKPGNPLYEKPILDIGDGMYQVFEVKQVIHAVNDFLQQICTSTATETTKYVEKKGKLLETRIIDLFSNFLKNDFKIYHGYYVDGCEQDILILWKNYAFIIEAKGYSLREPFRNPEKAFVRIKDDFNACIGYGYEQTRRVEKKFISGGTLQITDKDGKILNEIDTSLYEEDFSIIINLESFGQIQCDLSTLIKLENDDDVFPWAVKLDDLEIFILTMIAQNKGPIDFVNFLLLRESLHGKLICSDELEVCGGYLNGVINQNQIDKAGVVAAAPDLGNIFDQQYHKTMGFKNERNLYEKQSGKFIFW
jgi:hypothetical protein